MKLAGEVVRSPTCTLEVGIVGDLAVDFVALSANTAKRTTWNLSLDKLEFFSCTNELAALARRLHDIDYNIDVN